MERVEQCGCVYDIYKIIYNNIVIKLLNFVGHYKLMMKMMKDLI